MLSPPHLRKIASKVASSSRSLVLTSTPIRRSCNQLVDKAPRTNKRAFSSSSGGRPTSSSNSGSSSSSSSSSNHAAAVGPFAARQQKAEARAKELHNEIETIFKKHDHKREEEVKKVKSFKGFLDFLSKNKTNISVIVVSFLTVVLSVKLVQSKQEYRKLKAESEESQRLLEEKRHLLKEVSRSTFLNAVARDCAVAVNESSAKKKRWWSSITSSINDNSNEVERLVSNVLRGHIVALIGDAALTEDEINAKEIDALQHLTEEERESVKLNALSSSEGKSEKAAGTQEKHREDVVYVTDSEGKKIAKKSVFVI